MELRPYQRESLDGNARYPGIHRALAQHHSTLLVLPTATGKTIVFAHATLRFVQQGGRVLILADREELLDQAAEKLNAAVGLDCAVEKAEKSAVGALEAVTVGSVQTLMRLQRMELFPRDYYTHIIIDEAHHALSPSILRILAYWENAKVLGVTATPDRGDMKDLGQVFDCLAYEYKFTQAIHDGFLCPIVWPIIPLDIKLAEVGKRDWSDLEVGEALAPYVPQIADALWRTCSGRKLLVFAPLCKIAQMIRDALGKVGFRAYYASGEDRHELPQWDREGRGACLVNAMLCKEGYDRPSIDAVCVLRFTKLRSLLAQMFGRGFRPGADVAHLLNSAATPEARRAMIAASSKPNLLTPDFIGHDKHLDLCRPAHLFAESKEVADIMVQQFVAAAGGEAQEIDDAALALAQDQFVRDREEALAKKLAEQRRKKARLVDPLQFAASIGSESLMTHTDALPADMAPPSIEQLRDIEAFGVSTVGITAGAAAETLAALRDRQARHMASPKQIRFLERQGFKHAGAFTSGEAGRLCGRITANHFQLPDDMAEQIARGA